MGCGCGLIIISEAEEVEEGSPCRRADRAASSAVCAIFSKFGCEVGVDRRAFCAGLPSVIAAVAAAAVVLCFANCKPAFLLASSFSAIVAAPVSTSLGGGCCDVAFTGLPLVLQSAFPLFSITLSSVALTGWLNIAPPSDAKPSTDSCAGALSSSTSSSGSAPKAGLLGGGMRVAVVCVPGGVGVRAEGFPFALPNEMEIGLDIVGVSVEAASEQQRL